MGRYGNEAEITDELQKVLTKLALCGFDMHLLPVLHDGEGVQTVTHLDEGRCVAVIHSTVDVHN